MRTTAAVFLFLFAVAAAATALPHPGEPRSAEADIGSADTYALFGNVARN